MILSFSRGRRRAAAWAAIGSLVLIAAPGCMGQRLRVLEESQKKTQKDVEELRTAMTGMEKRFAVRQAMSGGADAAVAKPSVAMLLADTLSYSGRTVQVEAVLAGPVDKDRAFFVALNKPKDALSNVGVYYDPEELASKRDVYLSDPGQWLLIEGQLVMDKEPNGYKAYSGYALKAKTVRKVNK